MALHGSSRKRVEDSDMTTVRETIRERFPEHCQRICEIIHERREERVLDMIDFSGLRGWFVWESTSEGYHYWRALHDGDVERSDLERRTT
jgi:hypothetical protein